MKRIFVYIFLLAVVASCKKGEKNANQNPDTKVIPHIVNLEGDGRLRSTVDMAWFGSDGDGYITGYEFSLDNVNWHYTTKSDSTFIFDISEGSDTSDIDFYVRSIDNSNLKDMTPAYVRIPIKNTPPDIIFDEVLSTTDTAFIVTSIFWDAKDDDGDDNLLGIELKINNGQWYSIDKKYSNLTLVPENSGTPGAVDCKVYFSPDEAESLTIDGLVLGDTNVFYIRAFDVANSFSIEDTLTGLYVRPKNSDLLVIGGDRDFNSFYQQRITNAVGSYDFVDYAVDNGKWQPAFWNSTFYLMIAEYDQVCIFSDKKEYVNASTGLSALIIESSARPVQDFTNEGGKVLTIGYFTNPVPANSLIFSVYPVDSMDVSSGIPSLARSDSALLAIDAGYPDLGTTSFPLEISPFQESSDAVVIYEGEIDPFSGYTGPKTLGVKRANGSGNTNMVFIASGLNIYGADYTQVDALFNHVLKTEFNW